MCAQVVQRRVQEAERDNAMVAALVPGPRVTTMLNEITSKVSAKMKAHTSLVEETEACHRGYKVANKRGGGFQLGDIEAQRLHGRKYGPNLALSAMKEDAEGFIGCGLEGHVYMHATKAGIVVKARVTLVLLPPRFCQPPCPHCTLHKAAAASPRMLASLALSSALTHACACVSARVRACVRVFY